MRSASGEPLAEDDRAMACDPPPDLSRACWRCTHWGGFAFDGLIHSQCSRFNATPIQASPATGCDFWAPGPGDGLPPDWKPLGFVTRDGPTIYGRPLEPLSHRPNDEPQRPGIPSEAAAWDREQERKAWRTTDALLSRARRS